MIYTSASLEETKRIAQQIIPNLEKRPVVALLGEMGAGKTTLTQEIARHLGVESAVLSPTFVLMRQYKTKSGKNLYHADLYRLNDLAEIQTLGFEDIWTDPNNILIIEWPEKILRLLPEGYLTIKLKRKSDNEREIEIT